MTKEEFADQYACEKAEDFSKLCREAYLKGYEQGMLNVAHSITINGVEYVDLGLPSGTLWSRTPFKGDSAYYAMFSHREAQKYPIPTEEQVNELLDNKRNINDKNFPRVYTIGPSGERIDIVVDGKYKGEGCTSANCLWIKGEANDKNEAPVLAAYPGFGGLYGITEHFTGYKLPIYLVKQKEDLQ